MLERVRATVCIWQYETKGKICAIRGTIVVWSLSIVYTIYVILSALADTDTFGQPMGVVYLTSKYNATIILYTYYLILFIATITTICDFVIYRKNKTFKKSANYQLNENLLAMRFILPLDASYALFFGLYLISVAALRIYRDKIGDKAIREKPSRLAVSASLRLNCIPFLLKFSTE
uniref:Serpentine receptor class gamma n=1 Tax=Meloidogyne javanica TaxID=6303 RepID=A0A915NA91_MELJA